MLGQATRRGLEESPPLQLRDGDRTATWLALRWPSTSVAAPRHELEQPEGGLALSQHRIIAPKRIAFTTPELASIAGQVAVRSGQRQSGCSVSSPRFLIPLSSGASSRTPSLPPTPAMWSRARRIRTSRATRRARVQSSAEEGPMRPQTSGTQPGASAALSSTCSPRPTRPSWAESPWRERTRVWTPRPQRRAGPSAG